MTGESRSMEQNVLERSGLMKDFLSEKINGLKRERLKEIREKFESNVGNVRKQFESVLGAITSEAEQEIIVISYLRASYITETHEFYVGVYKGELFVEEIKHGFISVKPLLGNVEKDFVELDQALEREFFRLIAAEKEEIHRWYMEQLYQEFGTVWRFKGKNIYFGGFMDEISLIGDG